MTLAAKTERK